MQTGCSRQIKKITFFSFFGGRVLSYPDPLLDGALYGITMELLSIGRVVPAACFVLIAHILTTIYPDSLPALQQDAVDRDDESREFHSPFEKSPAWNMVLEYCLNPKNFEREIKQMDIDFIVFRDKFPKAKLHAVIAPRRCALSFSDPRVLQICFLLGISPHPPSKTQSDRVHLLTREERHSDACRDEGSWNADYQHRTCTGNNLLDHRRADGLSCRAADAPASYLSLLTSFLVLSCRLLGATPRGGRYWRDHCFVSSLFLLERDEAAKKILH